MILSHLTLNTGHLARTPRSDVRDDEIDRLLPIVDRSEGAIPVIGCFVDVFRMFEGPDRRPTRGLAAFQIAPGNAPMSKMPLVFCVSCWDEKRSSEAWRQAHESHKMFHVPMAAGVKRPRVPWLTVSVSPFMLADGDPERAFALGDAERCLAWALIESER